MTTTTGTHTASDGVELQTRSWTIENPRYDVLLVHGLGEHSGRWDEPAAFLNRHGANVYSFDLRGHGESGGDRVDLEEFASLYRDISEMATATAASTGRPWVLYAHSFGALQGAGYLIREYEPAPNVAVLSAPPMQTTRTVDTFNKIAANVLSRITPTLSIGNSINGEDLSSDPAIGEAYFADPLIETKATVRFAKVVFDEMDDLSARHGEITTPTLVFHGAEDPLVEPSASAGLAASPGVQRKVYSNLRHETHNEREASLVLGDMTDWVDGKLF